jgi:hypothetical protein
MAKQEKKAEAPKPTAVTYYGERHGTGYRIMRVDVYAGGETRATECYANPQRVVAAERLRVLLLGVGL